MIAIRYIEHQNIDKTKWDKCILNSINGHVYSTSLYLDIMAGKWDALIGNDYEAVLPLPWRKKIGLHYVYPPAFTQQLGLIYQQTETEKLLPDFIKAIPTKFRYIEMNLNAGNHIPGFPLFARKNYLLPLSAGYNLLRKNFSRSAVRNITNATTHGIRVAENTSHHQVIELHRNRFKDEIGFKAGDYEKFSQLAENLSSTGNCYCIGAENDKGKLIAGSIYFIFKDRLYFIINGNTQESLQVGATHLLMDHTIRNFSESKFTLDFEGSDHPSFARFYEQYGAKPETYFFLKINRLPFPLNFLKPGSANPVSG